MHAQHSLGCFNVVNRIQIIKELTFYLDQGSLLHPDVNLIFNKRLQNFKDFTFLLGVVKVRVSLNGLHKFEFLLFIKYSEHNF